MRLTLLALLVAAAGCSFYARPTRESPFEPTFDEARAAQQGRALAASPTVARDLARHLRASGFQPLARDDRRHALGRDTLAAGFLPGKDALRAGQLVLVAVAEDADAAALGGFAELAGTLGRLTRRHLLPAPTVLFASLPRGRADALAALTAPPVWMGDSLVAVVVFGRAEVGRLGQRVPDQPSAGATARAGYAVVRDLIYAQPSVPRDSGRAGFRRPVQ